ncbi:MAG TPA: hypothetical protein VFR07_12065 [Mycobacteriales bacterium]|nr:hypothetical protein [Mycobacteriales bacterium]
MHGLVRGFLLVGVAGLVTAVVVAVLVPPPVRARHAAPAPARAPAS